jgi:hypothetical protein
MGWSSGSVIPGWMGDCMRETKLQPPTFANEGWRLELVQRRLARTTEKRALQNEPDKMSPTIGPANCSRKYENPYLRVLLCR